MGFFIDNQSVINFFKKIQKIFGIYQNLIYLCFSNQNGGQRYLNKKVMNNFLKENVKSADLMGIGYFYKQDQSDGYSWFQLEGEGLWDITYEQHFMIEECFKNEMRLLEMGTHADCKTLLEFQELTKKRCEALIKHFQETIGFPNGKPMKDEFMNFEVTQDVMKIISLINIQIYYMTQWETIPNDEYNGMNYVYKNLKLK